jgi:hypothetical protein
MMRPPELYVFWKMVRNVVRLGLGTSLANLTQAMFRPLAKLQRAVAPPVQLPLVQVCPALQVLPHAPQFDVSFVRFLH